LAGGDAEEVLQGGAAGDGEGGELVLGEELAGAVDAVLALGGGDGDGFVGAVFELLHGGWELDLGGWIGRALRADVVRVEGEDGRGGGGG